MVRNINVLVCNDLFTYTLCDNDTQCDMHTVWRISGVDGQVINNQGYQSHWGCQSYLTRDTRGK